MPNIGFSLHQALARNNAMSLMGGLPFLWIRLKRRMKGFLLLQNRTVGFSIL
jgi:hypothetical protein